MAKVTKKCRVCGKQYEACHTVAAAGVFRWQDVSCSPECGAEYLKRIRASRSKASTVQAEEKQTEILEDENNEVQPKNPVDEVKSNKAINKLKFLNLGDGYEE